MRFRRQPVRRRDGPEVVRRLGGGARLLHVQILGGSQASATAPANEEEGEGAEESHKGQDAHDDAGDGAAAEPLVDSVRAVVVPPETRAGGRWGQGVHMVTGGGGGREAGGRERRWGVSRHCQ